MAISGFSDILSIQLQQKAKEGKISSKLKTEQTPQGGLSEKTQEPMPPDKEADGGVVVRLMKTDDDIELTWPLYQAFHKESRYRNLPADKALRAKNIRENFINNPKRYAFFIAELKGEPVGFLSCMITRLLYTEYRSASVLGFYVLPSCRSTLAGGRVALKLLNRYRAWAKWKEAVEVQIHVTHGFDLDYVNTFFTKMGFRLCGGNYSMEI